MKNRSSLGYYFKIAPIMKPTFFAITLCIGLVSAIVGLSPDSHAQPMLNEMKAPVYLTTDKEVIIQVAEINEKNLPLVRQNIEAAGGMTYKGFCKELNVVLYMMDTNIHSDYAFLNVAFMNVSMGYLIKEGSISQVQAACGMPAAVNLEQTQN